MCSRKIPNKKEKIDIIEVVLHNLNKLNPIDLIYLILKFDDDNNIIGNLNYSFRYAAGQGYIHTMKWLMMITKEGNFKLNINDAFFEAVEFGTITSMIYLTENCKYDPDLDHDAQMSIICNSITTDKSGATLKWLIEQKSSSWEKAHWAEALKCTASTSIKNTDLMEYCINQGATNLETALNIALSQHSPSNLIEIDNIKWLIDKINLRIDEKEEKEDNKSISVMKKEKEEKSGAGDKSEDIDKGFERSSRIRKYICA